MGSAPGTTRNNVAVGAGYVRDPFLKRDFKNALKFEICSIFLHLAPYFGQAAPLPGGRHAPTRIWVEARVTTYSTQPSLPTQPSDSDAGRQKALPNAEARAPSKTRGRSSKAACVFV